MSRLTCYTNKVNNKSIAITNFCNWMFPSYVSNWESFATRNVMWTVYLPFVRKKVRLMETISFKLDEKIKLNCMAEIDSKWNLRIPLYYCHWNVRFVSSFMNKFTFFPAYMLVHIKKVKPQNWIMTMWRFVMRIIFCGHKNIMLPFNRDTTCNKLQYELQS